MSKDNQKVSQKPVKKSGRRATKEELQTLDGYLKRMESNRALNDIRDQFKKLEDHNHIPEIFRAYLKNLRKNARERYNHDKYSDPYAFRTYYNFLEIIYGYNSKVIVYFLGLKLKQVDQLKIILWDSCNKSEKNFLKRHGKQFYKGKKLLQLQFEVLKVYYKNKELGIHYSDINLDEFEKSGIDLRELEGFWLLAVEHMVHYWRFAPEEWFKHFTGIFETSPEEVIKYKIICLAYSDPQYIDPEEEFRIKPQEDMYPEPDYGKIYKYILNQIIKELNPSENYLDKLNKLLISIMSFK